jgi:hypothetical protein
MVSSRAATLIYSLGLVAAAVPWFNRGGNLIALVAGTTALSLLLELPQAWLAETALCVTMFALLLLDELVAHPRGIVLQVGGAFLSGPLYALPIWAAAGSLLRAALYDDHDDHELREIDPVEHESNEPGDGDDDGDTGA